MKKILSAEEKFKIKSDATRRMWLDPEYRRKRAESLNKTFSDPVVLQNRNDAIKRTRSTKESRERTSIASKTTWEDPLVRTRRTNGVKAAFDDPEIKKRHSDILKVSFSTPQQKQRRSKATKKMWEDPEFVRNAKETRRGQKRTDGSRTNITEGKIGGFWYGNVRYVDGLIYCNLWGDVNIRVHAFYDYKCVLCGQPENGHSHIGHHVFYVKKACCWHNDEGVYYTNLNVRGHKENDYCIGKNPNYFVLLCPSCHGKTNGRFANRKKYADLFKEMIDTYYEGKCYLTKEEYAALHP